MAAHQTMKLNEMEVERITDSVLKIQSIRASLDHIAKSKIPRREEIESCLETVDDSFREALGYQRSEES
jgi:hypothetical protein